MSTSTMEATRDLIWVPHDDTRYVYAVAVVRASERSLLQRKTLEAMARASSADEAVQELGETSYARFMGPELSSLNFEELLRDVLADTYHFFRKLVLDDHLERAMLHMHDYHNLKALLKSRLQGLEQPVGLTQFGLLDTASLASAVESDTWSDIPEEFQSAARNALEAYELNPDPRLLEIMLDRHGLRSRIEALLLTGSDALRAYAEALADTTNIKLLIRLNHSDPDYSYLQAAYADGGTIPPEELTALLGNNRSVVLEALASTPYHKPLREGLLYLDEQGSYAVLDRELENHLMGLLQTTRFAVFGAGPLVAYVLAREHEVRKVRLVMVAKINGIPVDRIIARLSVLYV